MPYLPTHDHFLGTSRFSSLDGLRCLAVVPVVWHHSTPRPPSGLLGRGPLGVDLFFAISGFLITTLLLRERRRGELSVGRFYARRALRIFPAYYLVLGLTTLHWLFSPAA
ncbi:MAG TPA: acyltransferase [Polyangiaceae bacterium]